MSNAVTALAKSINAWIYLDEDEPKGTGYKTPNSSYQSLVANGVYRSTDLLAVCFFITKTAENGYYTIQIGNVDAIHPDGSTTGQYLDYTVRDARAANPNIKVLATLSYNAGTLSKIFSPDPRRWAADTERFANNVKSYLVTHQLDGLDIDWEGEFAVEISQEQFALLFQAMRKAFGSSMLLTLSPASVGNLKADTVNSCFDFVNLQLYSGFTSVDEFIQAGVSPVLLAYGAKFESSYQNANGAYDGYSAGFSSKGTHYDYRVATQWRLNSNNYAFEQGQQVLFHGLADNTPSISFDDAGMISQAGCPPIVNLTVRSGEVLDALQAVNSTDPQDPSVAYNLLQHGGNGGSEQTCQIAPGDAIVEISGHTGTWFGWQCVVQLKIKTRCGEVFGPFGTMGNVSSKTPFCHTAPSDQTIVAFKGATAHVPEAGGGTTYVVSSLTPVFG